MLYTRPYSNYSGPNTVLRSLDLSKSFQTSLDSVNYVRRETVPGTIPGVSGAALFPTESGFDLTFGAWQPYNSTIYGKRDPPVEDEKWQYDIATRRWTDTGITLRNWFQTDTSRRVSSSMTAWIPSLRQGFLFGGTYVSVNGTSLNFTWQEEHNGLITYDQTTNTWTNETTPFGGITDGGLVHITTARDEVLIQFGGRSGWDTYVRNFSEINIYSTHQSKWYTQHLPPGAVVPVARFAFCTALKSASDNSSHQIYIMGGLEAGNLGKARNGRTTASIWVLSIPSFEWAELPVLFTKTAANPKARNSPKCQAIGEHYIFYYGGMNTDNYFNEVVCDQKANAAFLFDVNALTWTDEFRPNNGTYEIPSEVIKHIGGGKHGGSPKKAPTNGWSDPDLETIMTLKAPPIPPGKNVGAIAGGTVGGVAAVALGLFGAMMLRRRRQRRSQLPPNSVELPSTGPYTLGEGGNLAELMQHTQVNSGGVWISELQPGEVARGMGAEH